MGEGPIAYTMGDLVTRVRLEGAGALATELGPFVLVGAAPTDDEDAWSFSTQVLSDEADPDGAAGLDLYRSIVHPLRKRGSTFAGTILIGRSSSNDLRIDHTTVSKLHARARLDADGFWLEDAASRNGTFVDGLRLDTEPVSVHAGDHVRFGSCPFRVHRTERFCDLLRRIRS